MNYPAGLHLPGIFGAMLGMVFYMQLWDSNKPLAIILLIVLMGGGIWLGTWLGEKWYKDLQEEWKKKEEDGTKS